MSKTVYKVRDGEIIIGDNGHVELITGEGKVVTIPLKDAETMLKESGIAPPENKIICNVRISRGLYIGADEFARASRRTFTSVIEQALEEFLLYHD